MDLDTPPDYVVLGQVGVLEADLTATATLASRATRFLPQEGFLAEVLFNAAWWPEHPDLLNNACTYYPALNFVRSASARYDFVWPTAEAEPVDRVYGDDGVPRRGETELHLLGYNAQLPDGERLDRLTSIIELELLPLRVVAETIAQHCRTRRRQYDGEVKYARALRRWEHDLEWLKARYYNVGRHLFPWPESR